MKLTDRLFNVDPIKIQWRSEEYKDFRKNVKAAAIGGVALLAANILGDELPAEITIPATVGSAVWVGGKLTVAKIKSLPLRLPRNHISMTPFKD